MSTDDTSNPFGAGPMGEMFALAVGMHELYSNFVRAGFDDDQAMRLTIAAMEQILGMAGGR